MSGIVNVHEAKTHFSHLLERVRRGEEVVIGKAGRPVARLVPIEHAQTRRVPGSARGSFRLARNFDTPLPKNVLDAFEK
jgi:prevent-host-death family protein